MPRSSSASTRVTALNHQVSSGAIPEDVIDNDIDPELSEEEAHWEYGVRVADWLCLQVAGLGQGAGAGAGVDSECVVPQRE